MKISTQPSSSSQPAHPLGFSWKIVLGKHLQKCWQMYISFFPKDLTGFYYPNISDGLENPHLYWAAEWEMKSKCETKNFRYFLHNDIKTRGQGGLASPFPLISSAPAAPAEGGCQWGAPCTAKSLFQLNTEERNEELLFQGASPDDGLSTSILLEQINQSLQPRDKGKTWIKNFLLVLLKPHRILSI